MIKKPDRGDAALVPSVRPTGIKMVVYGEDNDPFAASINVNPNHVLSKNYNFLLAISDEWEMANDP